MSPLVLVVVIFAAVALSVFAFGAAVVSPGSVLGARLRALGGQQGRRAENKPAVRERIEQALEPISKAIPLSAADVSRTRKWLIQAGYRDAIQVNYYFGGRIVSAVVGALAVLRFQRLNNFPLLFGGGRRGCLLPPSALRPVTTRRLNRL